MGKPLLMEEFGVWGGNRTEQALYFSLVLDAIEQVRQPGARRYCAGGAG